jgi:hypothetical protein
LGASSNVSRPCHAAERPFRWARKLEVFMAENLEWPKKIRELHNHRFDSFIWNDLSFRDDDIINSIYAKAGMTWMQQIFR